MREADRLCDRFEAAWQAGQGPRLEDYLPAAAAAAADRAALLHELLPLEIAYRRLHGECPEPAEYLGRFPGLDPAWVAGLVDGESAGPPAATTLCRLGKFELREVIGRGAFGTVWRAQDRELKREVAVKIPHPGTLLAPAVRERIWREARAAAQLRHPGIVTVFEVVTVEEVPVIVSEFVDGVSLRTWLRARHPGLREAAALVAAVAEALDYAHTMGVIHCDVKPANILLQRGEERGARNEGQDLSSPAPRPSSLVPVPKVTDFGLARGQDAEPVGAGQVIGTPAYMSPEQAAGHGQQLDRRADVYGLGVVLYEMVCGRPPFTGAGEDLRRQLLHAEPPPPRRLNPAVPRDLEAVILTALAKEPGGRYHTARALAEDLHAFRAGETIKARPPTAAERTLRWLRRRPALAALVLTSMVAVLALAGVVVALHVNGQIRSAFQETEQARRAEEAERRRAEANLYAHRIALAAREWSACNVGRAEQLLDECPPDQRGWEWPYLQSLCHGERLTLAHRERESYSVLSVAYSPDGRRLASASFFGSVRLWDAATGRLVRRLGEHKGGAVRVVYSPDGRRLASGGMDGAVRVWDADSGQLLTTLPEGDGCIYSLAFSPDGRRLASGSGNFPGRITDPSRRPGRVTLWDPATGRAVRHFSAHRQDIMGVAFDPHGRFLAAATGAMLSRLVKKDAGEVLLWDATDGRPVRTLRGHSGPLTGVCFAPDGRRLATSSWDRTVRIWDPDTGQVEATLRGHTDWVRGIVYSPTGDRLASAGAEGAVRLWNPHTGQELLALRGHRQAVTGVAFSPDGVHVASSSSDQTIKVWDAIREQAAVTLRGHTGPVTALAFGPHGRRLVSAAHPVDATGKVDSEIRIWDLDARRPVRTFPTHAGLLLGLALSPDGTRLVTAHRRAGTILWDTATGKELMRLRGPSPRVPAVAFSPHGLRLAAVSLCSEGPGSPCWELHVRDVADGRLTYAARSRQPEGPNAIAFSPDGWSIWAAGERRVVQWEAATGRELRTLTGHQRAINTLAFSPDGTRLATAGWDQTAKVWDTATGRELFTLAGHTRVLWGVAFSPDGRRLATAGEDQTVKLWDPATGQELLTLRGHQGFVKAVAFSPDGRRLASASYDGTVKIWGAAADPVPRD